jgi:citrate lyase subunit beta/citryl-CoA lyase
VPVVRSQLYVPGNRPDLFEKAERSGADALILDLEDAVPPAEKSTARGHVAGWIAGRAAAGGERPRLMVRVAECTEGRFLDDVEAVVAAGVDCVVVPKVETAQDARTIDRAVGWLEERAGRAPGSTLVQPILETALGIRNGYEIGAASARHAYMGGLAAKGADTERAIGFRASRAAWETIPHRARTLLDVRAADVPNPITGLWTDLDDLDGLRAFAEQGRDLGYDGMVVIHPKHVAAVNEVYGDSEEELDRLARLLAAMEEAERNGSASIRFEGGMVDIAMVKTARERLARAGRA